METKHTPGPWRIDENGQDVICNAQEYHRWGIGERHIATGFSCHDPANAEAYKAEAQANARLIAAAPALLEALQKLLANAEAVHSFGLPDTIPPLTAVCFSDAQTEARAAIAQAVQP